MIARGFRGSRPRMLTAGVAAVASLILSVGSITSVTRGVGPDDWPTAAPEAAGLDSAALADLLSMVGERDMALHSLLLVRDGTVVLDAYHHPYDGTIYHDVASVTKSVLTTLIGIAAEDGLLDLDAPVLSFFPDRELERDEAWGRVTVRHLASMTAGFQCIDAPEKVTQARMRQSEDYLEFVLSLPMLAEPGTTFGYCDPAMHLLSGVLTAATGMSALGFARTELFGPLGVTDVYWPSDPQGYSHGWGDLALKPRDMARIGQLFLQDGRWGDEQVVPQAWVHAATTRQAVTGRSEDYGYGWWVAGTEDAIDWFRADGDRGQRILVVPELDVVVVATGGGYEWDDVLDPVGAAATNGWQPLPPDPAAEALLAGALGELSAAPPATEPSPIPDTATLGAGITWAIEENPYVRALRVDFESPAEAVLTLDVPTEPVVRVDRVGLDGVPRPSVAGRPIMAQGRWADERTLEIEIDEGPGFHRYPLRVRFGVGAIELEVLELALSGTPMSGGG